jgi:ABC-type transport system substrate-binding protein
LCLKGLKGSPTPDTAIGLRQLAAWAHNRNGELLADAAQPEQALAEFQAAIGLDGNCALAIHNRGVTLGLPTVDDKFVALLDAAAAVPEDEVGAAYQSVDDYVAEQAPVIPWSYGENWWLVADGLRGLGNLTIGLLDFGRVSWDG